MKSIADVLNSLLQTNPTLGSSQGTGSLPSNAGGQGNGAFKDVMNQVAAQNSNPQNQPNSGNAGQNSTAAPSGTAPGSASLFESVTTATEIDIQVTETIQNADAKNPNQLQQSLLALAGGLQQLMALLSNMQNASPQQAQNLLVSASQGVVSPEAAKALVAAVQSFFQSLPQGQSALLSNPALQQNLLNQLVQSSLGNPQGAVGSNGAAGSGAGNSTTSETLDIQMFSSNATIAEITNNGSSASAVNLQTFAELISLAQAPAAPSGNSTSSLNEADLVPAVNPGASSNLSIQNLNQPVSNPASPTANAGGANSSLSQNFNRLADLLTQAQAGQVVLTTALKNQASLSDEQLQNLFGQNATLNQVLNALTQSVQALGGQPISNAATDLVPPVSTSNGAALLTTAVNPTPGEPSSSIQQQDFKATAAQQAAQVLGDINVQTLQTAGENATLDGFLALYTANSPVTPVNLNAQDIQAANANASRQLLGGFNTILTSFTANSPAAVIPAASLQVNTPNLQSTAQNPIPSPVLLNAVSLPTVNGSASNQNLTPIPPPNNAPVQNPQQVTAGSRVSNGVEVVSLEAESIAVSLTNGSTTNPSLSVTGSQATDAASVPPVVAGGVQPVNFTTPGNSPIPSTGAQPGSQGSTAVQNVQVAASPVSGTTIPESLAAVAMPANMAMAVGNESLRPVAAPTNSTPNSNNNVREITAIESNSTIVQPVGPALGQGVTSVKEAEDTFGLRNDLTVKDENLAAVDNGADVLSGLSSGSSDKTAFASNLPNSNASNQGNNGFNMTGIIDQLSGQVAAQVAQGHAVSRLSFQLVPENMGKVTIQIALVDQSVSAKILVNNADVKDGLQSHLVDLKTALNQAGLQIDQLQVQIQGGSSNLLAQYYQYQQEGSGYGAPLNFSGLNQDTPENSQNGGILGVFSQRNTLVNLLA